MKLADSYKGAVTTEEGLIILLGYALKILERIAIAQERLATVEEKRLGRGK